MRLLTKYQSKNLDKTSVHKYNIPESKLMDSAAKSIFYYKILEFLFYVEKVIMVVMLYA